MPRLIPELNIQINLMANATSISGAPGVGCHAGTMAGVSLTLHHTAPISLIDKSKGSKFKKIWYTSNWGDKTIDPELLKEISAILKDKPIVAEDHPTFAEDLLKSSAGIPLWFLSDVTNRGAPARVTGGFNNGNYGIPLSVIRTLHFAEYLIRNKIGYILETPLIQNPQHRVSSDYSINQGWVWIPPDHAKRAIGRAAEHIGVDFPSEEEWCKTVGKDIKIDSKKVLAQVFADGRFPEPRFLNSQPKSARAA